MGSRERSLVVAIALMRPSPQPSNATLPSVSGIVVGLLYSAGSVGSLTATLTSGWTSHVHQHVKAVAYAAAVWEAATAGFGLSGNIWLASAFLAVAGAADMVSGVFRSTIGARRFPTSCAVVSQVSSSSRTPSNR